MRVMWTRWLWSAAALTWLGACGTSVSSNVDATDADAGAPDAEHSEVGGLDAEPDEGDVGLDTVDDTNGTDGGADGSDVPDVPGDARDADAASDGTDAPDAAPDAGPDGDCVRTNACGGCAPLPAAPDTACGVCGDGLWACDGTERLVCLGAVGELRDWYPDVDGDGFGADWAEPRRACEPPTALYVDNALDCDDFADAVSPVAIEVCDGIDQDCDAEVDEAPSAECLDACCEAASICEAGRCLARCDEGATRCGPGAGVCCAVDTLCWNETCVAPGGDCRFTEDCAVEEICEPELALCLPRDAVPACEYRPPVGDFAPARGCRWTTAGLSEFPNRVDVVATPIVVNLTDDNGDGVTDLEDTPDIAFLTYDLNGDGCCNRRATLRVVDGQCNADGTMRTIASISSPELTNDTGIAAADLDGDGVAELLAIGITGASFTNPQGTIAFKRDADDGSAWSVLWHNTTYPTWNVHTRGGATISVADLEGDGTPEVVVGNVVLDGRTGTLRWDGRVSVGASAGMGNNAFLGPSSTVADLDLDGVQEVIAGNTVYNADGSLRWTYTYTTSNSACGGSLPCDGFNAVGNFDADPEGEVVIVRLGEVFVIEHNGTLQRRIAIPVDDCGNNESGPPTVADFDGDGRPEIGTASADFYVVVDPDCDVGAATRPAECRGRGILWQVPNQDCSSRATGSSVFDFEGDGRAEVVYADERNFRIFDGRTGAILFDDATHRSHTRIEMPVIADVDNDGNAEIVVATNRNNSGTQPGVSVWEDASDNWVRTRRIWNQHGYSVSNITERGMLPLETPVNWLNDRLNNFRQNVQPAGLFDAPDLVLADVIVLTGPCPVRSAEVRVVVRNGGALSVGPGTRVRGVLSAGDVVVGTQEVAVAERLVPGGEAEVLLVFDVGEELPAGPYALSVTVDPDNEINECVEDNGERTGIVVDCYSGG